MDELAVVSLREGSHVFHVNLAVVPLGDVELLETPLAAGGHGHWCLLLLWTVVELTSGEHIQLYVTLPGAVTLRSELRAVVPVGG